MKKVFLTPGPTALYPDVPQYIQEAVKNNICSVSHRSNDFKCIYQHTVIALKKLLRIPENFFIFFIGSATEAMERIIENCVAGYSCHFVNGAFSKRFFNIAEELKKYPEKFEVDFGHGFDFNEVQIPERSELICFTQNETSSGVAVNMKDIYTIKMENPDKLIVVDIVSSTPYVDIDYSQVDCTFFSVQKGFGLPAGLGVLIVNDKCIKKSQSLQDKNLKIGSYHNFPSLLKLAIRFQTPETPNVLAIYLLGKICDNLTEIGIENIRTDTEKKAGILYDFFDQHTVFNSFVQDKTVRSKTVIVVDVPDGSQNIINKLSKYGFVIGAGYKEYKDRQIRIANFPMHTLEDIERLLRLLSDHNSNF